MYNKDLIAERYMDFFKNEEEKFLVYISIAMENNEDTKVYIKYLRKALEVYPYMKKGIEILIEDLKKKVSNINDEFDKYKVQVKNTIKVLIESNKTDEANALIAEYEKIVPNDLELYSMKAVIKILKGELEDAEKILINGLSIDKNHFDLCYNLGYIYEKKRLYLKALETYENIVFNMEDNEQRQQIIEYLNKLEEEHKDIIQKQLDISKENKSVIREGKEHTFNLHLMYDSQYCDKFIHFVNEHFPQNEHKFIIIGNVNEEFKYMNIEGIENVQVIDLRYDLSKLLNYIEECSGIFVHYLFDYFCELVCRFSINKHVNWICWGGDFYNYVDFQMYDTKTKKILHSLGVDTNKKIDKNSIYYLYRKTTIRRLSKILISNKEDFNEIKEIFITNAKYNIFTYPNPVNFTLLEKDNVKFVTNENKIKKKFKYLILLGNSANPSNNHIEILHELNKLNSKDFAVIVPLSYGGYHKYVNEVIKQGKELLGDQFIALTKYIKSEKYFDILKQVDAAIFNHNRQQARGNIRILLYLGKKVYIKNTITTYPYFKNLGLSLSDISEIKNKKVDEIVNIDDENKRINRINIDLNFSPNKCFEYGKSVF